MKALLRDIEESNKGRARLTLVTTLIGIIGIFLWGTVIAAIILVQGTRGATERNGRIGVENIRQACYGYYQRTHTISPVCRDSEFVAPDGTTIR
jgi:hypothetical protein